MDNDIAVLVRSFADIFEHFKAIENKWHADPNAHSPHVFKEHVERDCDIYCRMAAFQDELVKYAEQQGQITIAEIEGEARTLEAKSPGR